MAERDERDLFGDEQAYITWKRQQEAEARREALRASEVRKKRRRVKYSDRIRHALETLRHRRRFAVIFADPEKLKKYRAQTRAASLRYYYAHRAERQEYARAYQRRLRDEQDPRYYIWREKANERKRQYRKTHPEYGRKHYVYDPVKEREYRMTHRTQKSEQSKRYYEAHKEDLRVKHREYQRARRAAEKAAKQQRDNPA